MKTLKESILGSMGMGDAAYAKEIEAFYEEAFGGKTTGASKCHLVIAGQLRYIIYGDFTTSPSSTSAFVEKDKNIFDDNGGFMHSVCAIVYQKTKYQLHPVELRIHNKIKKIDLSKMDYSMCEEMDTWGKFLTLESSSKVGEITGMLKWVRKGGRIPLKIESDGYVEKITNVGSEPCPLFIDKNDNYVPKTLGFDFNGVKRCRICQISLCLKDDYFGPSDKYVKTFLKGDDIVEGIKNVIKNNNIRKMNNKYCIYVTSETDDHRGYWVDELCKDSIKINRG